MSNIRKRVEISGDASGLSREMEGLAGTINRTFETANQQVDRFSGSAGNFADVVKARIETLEGSMTSVFSNLLQKSREHSDSAKERLQFINKEIQSTRQQISLENERLKIAEKMRYESELADAQDSGGDIKGVRITHQRNMGSLDEQLKMQKYQLDLIKRQADNEFSGEIASEQIKERQRPNYFAQKTSEVKSGVATGLGIAGFASIGGIIAKLISEGVQLDEAASQRAGLGLRNPGSGVAFGLKDADFYGYAANLAQQAGSADYNAGRTIEFEKRFSQELGSLGGLAAGLRTEDSGRNAADVALEMLGFFKSSDLFNIGKGDFTQLSEKIQFSTEMLQMQSQQMMTTNATTNAQILSALGAAGIDDQRSIGFVRAMNDNIRQPGNDFTRAFIMRSLRRRNPNASLLDLLKIQEQGIYGQGTLSQLVGDARNAFTGDALTMNMASMFGLQYHQAEQLNQLDPEMLENIGSKEQLEQVLSMSEGRGGAGVMSRRMAQLNNMMGRGGASALRTVDSYISAFEQGGMESMMAKMSGDITGIIEQGFNGAFDIIESRMDGWLGGVMGIEETKKKLREQSQPASSYNYNQVTPDIYNEPPQLEAYGFSPTGKRGFTIAGNETAGKYADSKVRVGLTPNEGLALSGQQMIDIFAFAVTKGLKEVTKEQADMLIKNGFDKTNEFLKELGVKREQLNSVYSTQD